MFNRPFKKKQSPIYCRASSCCGTTMLNQETNIKQPLHSLLYSDLTCCCTCHCLLSIQDDVDWYTDKFYIFLSSDHFCTNVAADLPYTCGHLLCFLQKLILDDLANGPMELSSVTNHHTHWKAEETHMLSSHCSNTMPTQNSTFKWLLHAALLGYVILLVIVCYQRKLM